MTTHTLIFSIILPTVTWFFIGVNWAANITLRKRLKQLVTSIRHWQENANEWEANYHEAQLTANHWKQLYEQERMNQIARLTSTPIIDV